MMDCFIYKSSKLADLYLYLDKKGDFSNIPKLLLSSLGNPEFVMELALTPNRKLARADAGEVFRSIQEKGFFVQLPPTKIPAPTKVQ